MTAWVVPLSLLHRTCIPHLALFVSPYRSPARFVPLASTYSTLEPKEPQLHGGGHTPTRYEHWVPISSLRSQGKQNFERGDYVCYQFEPTKQGLKGRNGWSP